MLRAAAAAAAAATAVAWDGILGGGLGWAGIGLDEL